MNQHYRHTETVSTMSVRQNDYISNKENVSNMEININELPGTIISAIGLLSSEAYEEAATRVFKDRDIVNDRDRLSQLTNILFLVLNCFWLNSEWKEDWDGSEPEITDEILLKEAKSVEKNYGPEMGLTCSLEENIGLLLSYGVLTKDSEKQTYHFDRDFLENYLDIINDIIDELYTTGEFSTPEGIQEYHARELKELENE